jgi:molybdopterin-guanine dinucleotide biosynthesis protein B
MQKVHIVGLKGHGKTTLVADLLREFGRRGLRVGTLKHSSHEHEVDRPGKDSHRHRTSGANPAAFATPGTVAVFVPRSPGENPFNAIEPIYESCDLVLVEGWIEGPGPKVEVWRAAKGEGRTLAAERDDIVAMVTDDEPPEGVAVEVWPRSDIPGLADRIVGI